MTEEQYYQPGTLLQDTNDMSYWLVLRPNEFYPIQEGSVANIINGQVKNIDWLHNPKRVQHFEIMW